MKKSYISKVLKSLAQELGIKIILENSYGRVGQIILPSGNKRYFFNTHLDINSLGASEIAHDKDYAEYFMKKMGYPVVESYKYYSDRWCKIINEKENVIKDYGK